MSISLQMNSSMSRKKTIVSLNARFRKIILIAQEQTYFSYVLPLLEDLLIIMVMMNGVLYTVLDSTQ